MPDILTQDVQHVGVDKVRAHTANPREGDVGAIWESIEANGFFGALVVQRSSGHILAGNHRWLAAKEAGMDEVPVIYVDVDDERAMRILLADNRTNDRASYNNDDLADLLEHLASTDEQLAGTGYDGDALDELLSDLGRMDGQEVDDPGAETDRAEELREKWSTERGQLWQIGRHRLLCGDSTDAEDVERLIGGGVDMCFTSPPYALGASVSLSGNSHMKESAYRDFEDSADDWLRVMNGFLRAADDYVSHFAVNIALLAGCKVDLLSWIGSLSYRIADIAIWTKSNAAPALAPGVFARADEYIIFISDDGASRSIPFSSWRGSQKSVYEGDMQRNNTFSDVHAATMPIDLAQWVIGEVCDEANTWYEPFAGTGTTIIAAENEARTCYAMEIDPAYCAVILERCTGAGLDCTLS